MTNSKIDFWSNMNGVDFEGIKCPDEYCPGRLMKISACGKVSWACSNCDIVVIRNEETKMVNVMFPYGTHCAHAI